MSDVPAVGESLNKIWTRAGKPFDRKYGTVAGWCSANLLGNRIQCLQNMFGKFAGFLVAELGMRLEGVPDQFEAVDVGRVDRRR